MFFVVSASMLMLLTPTLSKAENEKTAATNAIAKTSGSTEANSALEVLNAETAEANAGTVRLEEIKAMDMSSLTPAEKKELRKEVHMIQNQQDRRDRDQNRYDNDEGRRHRHGGVIFLGGGGLLIILLLILLL